MRAAWILITFTVACGGDTSYFGESHPPLRSPCHATDLPVLTLHKISCPAWPISPLTGDRRFWAEGVAPCRVRVESLAGRTLPGGVEYDHSAPLAVPGATYDEDGRLATFYPSYLYPTAEGPTVTYEYDGSTLVGATGADQRWRVEYADGLRETEGSVVDEDVYVAQHRYRYEAGRVVSRRPAKPTDTLPDVPTEGVRQTACGTRVPDLSLDGTEKALQMSGATYFYYDGDRVSTVVHGNTPGTTFEKYDFAYDGARLSSVTLQCTGGFEGPRRWIYDHDC